MFSCECCEVFESSFFYRTPRVAALVLGAVLKVRLYRNHHYKSLYDTKNYQWLPVEYSSKLNGNENVRRIQEKNWKQTNSNPLLIQKYMTQADQQSDYKNFFDKPLFQSDLPDKYIPLFLYKILHLPH